MGPPGKMSVNEMNHIKEAMKGAKGDHGPEGAQGSTGERGDCLYYNCITIVCLYTAYESEKFYKVKKLI